MTYTYDRIKAKIRLITGRPSEDQLSETDLDEYINNFYVVKIPNSLKIDEMLKPYSFLTTIHEDVYAFPSATFYTLEPVARSDGMQLFWYEDANLFYADYPPVRTGEELAAGNAVLVTFAGTLDADPVVIGSVLVYDSVELFTDNGDGSLTGAAGGTGTINYETGAYSVTFNAAPAKADPINAKYEAFTPAAPRAILHFNNEYTLRPIPDDYYNITMQGYMKPSAMTLPASVPFSDTLGPLVIYGTSLDIYAENGDMEHYGQYYPIYLKYYDLALDKTTQNLSHTRSTPTW